MGKVTYNGDIKELIDEAVKANMKMLERKGFIKSKELTAYQKTEKVLYDYNDYVAAVKDKEEKIEDIKNYGLSKRSMSFIPMPSGSFSTNGSRLEEDRENEAIAIIEKSIELTKRYITIINDALMKIDDDKYKEIIYKFYMEGNTCDEIANYYGIDPSTVRKNKSKLVRKISIHLFSNEVISELYS